MEFKDLEIGKDDNLQTLEWLFSNSGRLPRNELHPTSGLKKTPPSCVTVTDVKRTGERK